MPPSNRYRQIMDELVRQTREGQGTVGAKRARSGVWNANATPQSEQYHYNLLLGGLTPQGREIFAEMLAHEFVRGVHTALSTLHSSRVEPFEEGYQGTPAHDYMGRLGGWPWPA
jgi:hypothetical protein